MEYKILTDSDHNRLSKQVNMYLGRGYKLVGGISASVSLTGNTKSDSKLFAQAIIKE